MALSVTVPQIETLADLLQRLGDVPLARIRFHPFPGSATERDVIRELDERHRLCELVDGVLVEKAIGFYESTIAVALIVELGQYLKEHPLGIVAGADGTVTLVPGLVRIPDVSFVSWDRLPNRRVPKEPLPHLAPDLVVEVLSEGNTAAEMERKLGEYFAVGVRTVWHFEPNIPRLRVFSSPEQCLEMGEEGVVDGGDVLPGFSLSVRDWLQGVGGG